MTAAAALLIDFGSTYTKLRAVDLATGEIVGTGQGPSTVGGDINVGLDQALTDLEGTLGSLPDFEHRLASSSAAGGLAMITVGLIKELTAEAARLAALGAGAKLIGAHANKLTEDDARAIVDRAPDILLLAGGTDGGNEEVIRWNGERLSEAGLACPVVVAGNRNAADGVASTLTSAGIDARIAGNVMPEFNVLDVEPARAAIRNVFIERIVHAKGIDQAQSRFDAVLMPTPAAVLDAARLLAEGTDEIDGLGDLVIVDVGGATTDIHSIGDGAPAAGGVVQYGLPEPYAKRTVEGDLGMRHNARTIVDTIGSAAFAARANVTEAVLEGALAAIDADVERLPSSDTERMFDRALAETAVARAMARHAGTIEIKQTVTGPVTVQYGKDLTDVGTVVGTGGVLAHSTDGAGILSAAAFDAEVPVSLRPKRPNLYIDRNYSLYAVGLLAAAAPEAAMKLARHTLMSVTQTEDRSNDRSPAA